VSDDQAYIIDIRGLAPPPNVPPGPGTTPARAGLLGRPWVGIRFDCCGIYSRIYRDADGAAYHGRCPRCLRQVRLRVGAGGTCCRFFVAE